MTWAVAAGYVSFYCFAFAICSYVVNLNIIQTVLATFMFHFSCSLIYNTLRSRNIFLSYYSDAVLSVCGPSITDIPTEQISKEKFKKTLNEFKNHVSSANEKRDLSSKPLITTKEQKSRGVYGPEDKIWEVSRESAAFFGGGRAVFLQLAHPYVASGVQQHSQAADDMQRRFYNTFHHMFRLNFGDLEVAEKSARQVRSIHDKIIGTLNPSPPYPIDTKYSANHKGAVIWVWATLAETSMLMYELLVQRMELNEKEKYYNDQKQFVRFFGVDCEDLPKDWNSFLEYNAKMWNSDILSVGETARKEDENLFRPRTFLAWLTNKITRRITFAMLPPKISQGFHVHQGPVDYFLLYLFFGSNRMIYSSLPGSLRYLTAYMEADARIKGYNPYNEKLSSFAAWMAGLILQNLIMDPKSAQLNSKKKN